MDILRSKCPHRKGKGYVWRLTDKGNAMIGQGVKQNSGWLSRGNMPNLIHRFWRELITIVLGLIVSWLAGDYIAFILTLVAGEIALRGATYVPEMFTRPLYRLGQYDGCVQQGVHFRIWPLFSWGHLIGSELSAYKLHYAENAIL
jgi:hypothetical protein